ncbi:wall-associated receptor kinase 2-like protein [Tanacetum coccineum]
MAVGTLQGSNLKAMKNIAKPGCEAHCGNIAIPYPFGIGNDTGCSLNNSFYVTCDTSTDPPKLFLASSNLVVHSFSDSELRLFTGVGYKCYDKYGDISSEYSWWTSLGTLTYTFSERNKFTVVGCDDIALIEEDRYFSGCRGLCSKLTDVDEGECSGKGCCQTPITKGLKYYNITLATLSGHINVSDFNKCGYAFLSEEDSFRFGGAKDLYTKTELDFYNRVTSSVPVVLDWVIAPEVRTCSEANECKGKSHCYDVPGGVYRCSCNQGYEGNPYLDQGCQGLFLVFF